jgi:RNA polymerase sigma-70 factor, ECF subfamily
VTTRTLDPEVVGLVERAQTGDGEAFAQLYDRYVDLVYGYIQNRVRNSHLAEDLTSDVFVRALRNLPKFKWQGVDIGAWLLTIARNRITDHFKSARVRLERTTEEFYDEPRNSAVDGPEAVAMARDLAANLTRALELLKGDHREVVQLRFVQGLSVAETALAMERSDGAVKALQYRALRALAEVVRNDPTFSDDDARAWGAA